MGESMGYKSDLALHSAADFTSGTPVAMKYISNTLQEVIPIEENDAIRCERSRNVADIALGNVAVAGDIVCNPNPVEWGRWFPYMGFSVSTNTWTLTDALADMYVRTYMGASTAEIFTFLTRVNTSTILIEPGKKVQLTQGLVGKTLTPSTTYSFPTINDASRPFMAYDLGSTTGITINSVANYVERIELSIDNKIDPTYMTGPTATDLEPGDRMVICKCRFKFNSAAEADLFTASRTGASVAGSFTLTNGGVSMLFSMAAMVPQGSSPQINDRGKIRQDIEYHCYKTGATGELVITLDQTP